MTNKTFIHAQTHTNAHTQLKISNKLEVSSYLETFNNKDDANEFAVGKYLVVKSLVG